MMMLRISVLFSLSILSACATYNQQAPVSTSDPEIDRDSDTNTTSSPVLTTPEPIRIEPGTRPPVPAPEPSPPRTSEPATPASTLITSVDQAITDGDLERAAALSERALRISPRDAYLWYRLAAIRYQQRQYDEAEGFARRALSFVGNDRELMQQINQLLSQINSGNG